MRSLPAITKALQRGKVTPQKALLHPHKAPKDVKRIFEHVEGRDERIELNLYVVGEEDDAGPGGAGTPGGESGQAAHGSSGGGQLPAERSPNL
jgi:succinate dehydrogenase / fumarate reductase iron-sulfur subunit